MKALAKLILRIIGWKAKGTPPDATKFIAVAAPHTSNIDFILGRLYFFSIGKKPNVLIKKELFFFPLGNLLKALGGISVDRKRSGNVVDQMAELFQQRKNLILVITPEGTRSRVKNWKKGFYHIARKADVPVLLGGFDYGNKIFKISSLYKVGDDPDKEMQTIKAFFKDCKPRHPEKFDY